ncbi:MAG: hypothetical protein AAGF94_02585 [Pseudomonadota bacterium]
MSDLYKPSIYDQSVDIRARYFRECEAMLAYYMSRGIVVTKEISDEIGGLAGYLTIGIDKRDEIPMSALNRLHHLLADSIKPALPRTIEMMHWDARNRPMRHRIAPVPAIRNLIMFTIFSFALGIWMLVQGGDPALYKISMFDMDPGDVIHVTLFYAALASTGACFSVLYDARKYVIEGSYDPRIGSNYGIRILLGIVAGLILTQLLADPKVNDDGQPTTGLPYGMPILALLGGFASQFVYNGLNKMVEAASSIFEPNRAQQVDMAAKEIRVATAENNMSSTLGRIEATVDTFAEIARDPKNAASPETLGKLLKIAGSSPAAQPATRALGAALGPHRELLDKVEGAIQAGKVLSHVLPGRELRGIVSKLGRLESTVDGIKTLAGAGAQFDAAENLLGVARNLGELDPTRAVLKQAVKAFGGLRGIGTLAMGPTGLAVALILGSARLGGTVYDRWKTRVLGAAFSQDLLPPGLPNSGMAKTILQALPDLSGPIGAPLMDNPAALTDFARNAVAGHDDALFSEYGEAVGGDRASFDAALNDFRTLAVGEVLQGELPDEVVEAAGAENPQALFDFFDQARGDREAFKAMDELFLAGTNAADDEKALQGLLNGLASIAEEETTA